MTTAYPRKTLSAEAVLWLGIAFSLIFTGIIWLAGTWLDRFALPPDQGAWWYEWQLAQPTFWTHATAWGFYLLHQVTVWATIYFAQSRNLKYTDTLHPVNLTMLGVNAVFTLIHFAQTHIWYDGLAQDTPIWSSQGSVIVMLVAILLMENQRRGLFFGKKVKFLAEAGRFWRTYHGYVFSWAIVYTFWFHPMVATSGHLIGFLYMFLLMVQGSLFFTRIHINKWWTFFQEAAVLAHGTLVAINQGNGLWPMFAFGFAGLVVITQAHGLGLSRAWKWAIAAIYVGGVLVTYYLVGWDRLNEVVRIPLIEYASVVVLAGLTSAGLWIGRLLRRKEAATPSEAAPAT